MSRLPSIGKIYVDDWFHIFPVTHGFLLQPKRGNLLLHIDEEKINDQDAMVRKYILIDTKNNELIQFEHKQPKDNSETTLEITHWEQGTFNSSECNLNPSDRSLVDKRNRDVAFW